MLNVKYVVNFEFAFSHAAKDSKIQEESDYLLLYHSYTKHFAYQNIWMTGYLDWYVIVNIAYNMLIIWPISQDYFISSI